MQVGSATAWIGDDKYRLFYFNLFMCAKENGIKHPEEKMKYLVAEIGKRSEYEQKQYLWLKLTEQFTDNF